MKNGECQKWTKTLGKVMVIRGLQEGLQELEYWDFFDI